ncbi:MAG: M15 family metallopeptidase [Oceanicoccus sp.]|uniref:M15 family metallopeptidase n=1 Tax=Oceanicoccus sp. TaxID=2691044 RepID=UPI002633444A|nr:M15 family metallopeptidase [Oceanicoccus sp.]MCP3906804.1 M15 family metallopeptidase [Oceanicoccus sp.]
MQAATSLTAGHLYGLDSSDIDFETMGCGIHREALRPFQRLQLEAKAAGFELVIASGYRDFERQLLIWNAKANGERPVLDQRGQPVDMAQLDPWQQVQAILRWSALPGASRHHWGSDIDIYDRAAIADDYQLQLTTEETVGSGPFAPLHQWLDQQINTDNAQGFFRPYQIDQGGIAPERWHLSFAPLSSSFQQEFALDDWVAVIQAQPVALKNTLLENIDRIFQHYIDIPQENYPQAFQLTK